MFPTQYPIKMHEEVTTRLEYEPMLEETITSPIVKPMDWQLTNQKPMSRAQVYCDVKGKNDMRAVPKTQSRFPTVIIKSRVLAHRVATSPAISREMTWSDLPAQSSSAALNVEYPKPLMIDPEKLVKTPLGTDDPNMATERSQLQGSANVYSVPGLSSLFRVPQGL